MLTKIRELLGEQLDSSDEYPQTVWTDQFLFNGINQASDRLERDGLWLATKKDTSLTTTAGTNRYELPDGLQEVQSVYIGDVGAGLEYTPMSVFDFDNVVAGSCYKIESDGAPPGIGYITFFPTPTTTGETITLKGTWRQNQLTSTAAGTITLNFLATSGTFVIDTQTFEWKLARGTTGDIPYGSSISEALENLVTYVNTDLTTVTASVSGSNTVLITANTAGAAGDAIVFTEAVPQMTMDGDGTLGGTAGYDIVSSLPDRYHMYFVWSAVAYAREREEEPALADRAQYKADQVYDDLMRNELSPGGQQLLRMKHPSEYLH